jgi:hypothetical protein
MRVQTRVAMVALWALCSTAAGAQLQRPRAELTPVAADEAKPGSTVLVSLKVRLPRDVHVQADKPRDPSLIATVMTVDAPNGVSVEKISYPDATELTQEGRREKLLVFGPEFEITATLAVAASVTEGELVVPVRLRYQACNDTMCFPPARADARWTLRVNGAP